VDRLLFSSGAFALSLFTIVTVLGQDQRHDQSVQRQRLAKDQHDDRADVEFAGRFRVARLVGQIQPHVTGCTGGRCRVKFASTFGPDAKSPHAHVANDTDGTAGRQAGQAAAQTGRELRGRSKYILDAYIPAVFSIIVERRQCRRGGESTKQKSTCRIEIKNNVRACSHCSCCRNCDCFRERRRFVLKSRQRSIRKCPKRRP
jgi:hypothetical protein